MVSVIIPAYNEDNYLERCLDSILNQSEWDFEIILINDGSTDRTGFLCDEYAGKYPRVRAVHQKNSGVSTARNHGLELAEGEYIVFMDADDYADSSLFQIISENIEESLDVLLLDSIMEDGKSMEGRTDLHIPAPCVFSEKDRNLLMEQCLYGKNELGNEALRSSCGKVFRTVFLRENGIYFPPKVKIGEDMIFMLRVYSHMNKAKYCPKTAYHFFFHHSMSVTNRYKPELESIFSDFAKEIAPWLEKYPECRPLYSWYRLNDIVLYMKDDFFHPKNREKEEDLKNRMERILLRGDYVSFYNEAKEQKLLKKYGVAKRLTFWCAINGRFGCLKAIYRFRYRSEFGKKYHL